MMGELLWRLWNDPRTVRKFIVALLTVSATAIAVGAVSGPLAVVLGFVGVFCNALGVYGIRNDERRNHDVQR